MKHKHWNPGTLMAQAYRDIANEHNATVDALQAALAPIRVPFSDEVIEKMAREASYSIGGWGYDNWDKGIMRDAWRASVRRALAAGGLEPCAVPDYAPEDVAFGGERASDEELEHVYEQGREFGELVNLEGIRAVRARVEAPLLAEIRHLRGKLASAHQKTERQAAELTKLYHLRQGDAGDLRGLDAEIARLESQVKALSEIDENALSALSQVVGLRAQLDAVTAERDAMQDDAAAIFDIAAQDDADTPLEAVRKLKEYADTIEWREANTESAHKSLLEEVAALRQPVDADMWKTDLRLMSPLNHNHRMHLSCGDDKLVLAKWLLLEHKESGFSVIDAPSAARAAQWLASYAAAHGCPASGAIQYKRNPANDGFVDMPTDAQVEALARVLYEASHKSIGGTAVYDEIVERGQEQLNALARAAYAHFGRVPVGNGKKMLVPGGVGAHGRDRFTKTHPNMEWSELDEFSKGYWSGVAHIVPTPPVSREDFIAIVQHEVDRGTSLADALGFLHTNIGRVPVGWELDVTADVIEVIARSSSRQTRAKEILDLCRSRIKPVSECNECAKKQKDIDLTIKALEMIKQQARTALEA